MGAAIRSRKVGFARFVIAVLAEKLRIPECKKLCRVGPQEPAFDNSKGYRQCNCPVYPELVAHCFSRADVPFEHGHGKE